jgi:DNA-directed RNA polymerase beta' subunit
MNNKILKLTEMLRKRDYKKSLFKILHEAKTIESIVTRHVIKKIKDKNHKLTFESGYLKILATTIKNKLVKELKEAYFYEKYKKEINFMYFARTNKEFEKFEIVDDKIHKEIIDKRIDVYLKLDLSNLSAEIKQLFEIHFLLGSIISTVYILENLGD